MLKRIFSWKNQKNSDNLFLAEFDGFLLDSEEFLARMRQERLRSERYGTPLSLVIIDIPRLVDFSVKASRVSPRSFLRHLSATLQNSTRELDLKGWYQEGKIALIAPNTNESGARALAENLIKSIAKYPKSDGNFQEKDLKQFITLSSLQRGSGYLANGPDESVGEIQASPLQELDIVEFASPQPDTPYPSLRAELVDVAAVEWPLSIEILRHEQVRELQLIVKRVIDITGSLAGIILYAPLMLIVAILIKLTSSGPVLFRQERLGFLGKPFTFVKFRSMKVDCDESVHQDYVTKLINGQTDDINRGTGEQPLYKITDDPRVTRFGKFLRKSSLDELPQFFNVLKGDMSLVGPRPPIPYECDQYKRWHCRRVLEVKPGITGLWQVSGRSSTTFDEMVRLDLAYIRNWSLWLDFKIILKTFWAVVSMKGGY